MVKVCETYGDPYIEDKCEAWIEKHLGICNNHRTLFYCFEFFSMYIEMQGCELNV